MAADSLLDECLEVMAGPALRNTRGVAALAGVVLLAVGEAELHGSPWAHLLDLAVPVGFFVAAAIWGGRPARASWALVTFAAGAAWCVSSLGPRVSALWWPAMGVAVLAVVLPVPRVRGSWAVRASESAVAVLVAAATCRAAGADRLASVLALAGAATLLLVAVVAARPGGDAAAAVLRPAGTATAALVLVAAGIGLPVMLSAVGTDLVVPAGAALVSMALAVAGGCLVVTALMDSGPGAEVTDRVVELAGVPGGTGLAGVESPTDAGGVRQAYDLGLAMLESNRALTRRLEEQVARSLALQRRLVTAADTERAQLASQLATSVRPLLAELAVTLRAVDQEVEGQATHGAALEALAEVDRTDDDLSRIAQGLHPRLLSDEGLRAALADLAARLPLPVSTQVPAERFAPTVETTVWYLCAEALTNTVKHSGATRAWVSVERTAEGLVTTITDDGTTRAPGRIETAFDDEGGGGLAGVRDRVVACGGSLRLQRLPTGGLSVVVSLPC